MRLANIVVNVTIPIPDKATQADLDKIGKQAVAAVKKVPALKPARNVTFSTRKWHE